MFARLVGLTITAFALMAPLTATAQDAELTWNEDWNRVTAAEWAVLSGAGLSAAAVRLFAPPPDVNWRGGLLFDEDLYLAVAPENETVWRSIANTSHVGFFGSITYRVVEDLAVVGAGKHSWDVAWQMLGMDLQALSLIATVLWIPQLWIGRERPVLMNCDHPTRVSNKCDQNPERNRSFWAGHPATATAYAGLTCFHHARLKIYGGGFADRLACGAMITNAAITGISRMIAGYHWASDVLIGFAVGTIAWLVPVGLHYGLRSDEPSTRTNEAALYAPF